MINRALRDGATIFEKHVAVPTEKYGINNYSSTPEQLDNWLNAAQHAKKVYGMSNERLSVNPDEKKSLRSLQRGAYARTNIMKGKFIELEDFVKGMENIKFNCDFHLFDSFLAEIFIDKDVYDFIGVYSKHCDKERFAELKQEIKKQFDS